MEFRQEGEENVIASSQNIKLLDPVTIDKIAAGEVVERPASVVKELVENSMDAGASRITVEIKKGGIEFIRVTDNGEGIHPSDMKTAFLRHATSKLATIEDLSFVTSMGFRGEALASISSVSKMECISKVPGALLGTRYYIEGGKPLEYSEVGAPEGTTMVVRNLFYNTPVRRKFLKSDAAEGNMIKDLMEHLAMSRPDISFQFIMNGQTKFSTTGSNDLREIIYRLYGREVIQEIIPMDYECDGILIQGYLGKPSINRPNRNYENYFLNYRYIKSDVIAGGLEEGYKPYVMQHKFPFCVLHISMNTKQLDVNVHPTKKEVRFMNNQAFFEILSKAVRDTLKEREMIPSVSLDTKPSSVIQKESAFTERLPEVFEENRRGQEANKVASQDEIKPEDSVIIEDILFEEDNVVSEKEAGEAAAKEINIHEVKAPSCRPIVKPQQLSLFEEEKVLSAKARKEYEIIGQVFQTYWLISYQDAIYFVDQHAAHEKVNYERIMQRVKEQRVMSQQCNPPVIITLSGSEENLFLENEAYFSKIGFTVESFGGNEYALREIPYDLFSTSPKDLFLSVLEQLSKYTGKDTPELITGRIASMACKASVKGGMRISRQEMEALLDEMLTLENPYHCPHGRPTMFSMSRYELEKRFKRIGD